MSVPNPAPANAGNPPANASGNPAEVTVDPNLTSSDPAATIARLLEESKAHKARAQKAEKELADKQRVQDEATGEYKKLYEAEKLKHEGLYKSLVKSNVKQSVTSIGTKHGLVDVDAALALGNRELLQFDAENASVHGADAFIEDLKKTRPYLFGKASLPTINPANPGGGGAPAGPAKVTAENFGKLPMEQREGIWSDLLKKAQGK